MIPELLFFFFIKTAVCKGPFKDGTGYFQFKDNPHKYAVQKTLSEEAVSR